MATLIAGAVVGLVLTLIYLGWRQAKANKHAVWCGSCDEKFFDRSQLARHLAVCQNLERNPCPCP